MILMTAFDLLGEHEYIVVAAALVLVLLLVLLLLFFGAVVYVGLVQLEVPCSLLLLLTTLDFLSFCMCCFLLFHAPAMSDVCLKICSATKSKNC